MLVLGVSPGLALMKPWAPSPQMAIVFNQEGLSAIQPPCVVQNFINHNAVLYKVFVVGDSYTVVQRPSLKNFSAGTSGNCSPLYPPLFIRGGHDQSMEGSCPRKSSDWGSRRWLVWEMPLVPPPQVKNLQTAGRPSSADLGTPRKCPLPRLLWGPS